MEGNKSHESTGGGDSHHNQAKKKPRSSAHSHPKPVNPLQNHPMFQRRTPRLEKHRKNYFAWFRFIPQAISFVRKYVGPKKKAVDPNAPVLGIRETQELRKLGFTGSERKRLLLLFREITGEKRNTASFRAFARYFRLAPDVWAMRTFEIMNHQLTGNITFLEFVTFIVKYLVVDRELTEEFCFRLLSRRGISFMPDFSILDLEDFLTIVVFRYKEFATLPVQKKVALDLFSFADADNDGGVTVHEFRSFSAANPVLLRTAHLLLNHLRKCIFGIEFWVGKSRQWRAKQSSGVVLAYSNQRHIELEAYFGQALKEPVIDPSGNPLPNEYYLKQYEAKKRAEDEHHHRQLQQQLQQQQQQQATATLSSQDSVVAESLTTADNSAQQQQQQQQQQPQQQLERAASVSQQSVASFGSTAPPPGSLTAMTTTGSSSHSFHSSSHATSGAQLLSATSREPSFAHDAASESADSHSNNNNNNNQSNGQASLAIGQRGVQMLLTTGVDTQTMLAKERDYRTLSSFPGPFSLQKIYDGATFAHDFPEIVRLRQQKRRERHAQEKERRENIIQMRREAYVRLIKICSDLVNRRSDVRSAFARWLRVAEKQSRAEVNAPHRSDLRRVDEHMPNDYYDVDDDDAYAYGNAMMLDELDSVSSSSLGHHHHGHSSRHHHHGTQHQQQQKQQSQSALNQLNQQQQQSEQQQQDEEEDEEEDEEDEHEHGGSPVVMLGQQQGSVATESNNISALSNDFFFIEQQLAMFADDDDDDNHNNIDDRYYASQKKVVAHSNNNNNKNNKNSDAFNIHSSSSPRPTQTTQTTAAAILVDRSKSSQASAVSFDASSISSVSSPAAATATATATAAGANNTRRNLQLQSQSPFFNNNKNNKNSNYNKNNNYEYKDDSKQVNEALLLQDELRRSFHPFKSSRQQQSETHQRIVEDDDRRHAEREVRAADDFVRDYLSTRFFVAAAASSASSSSKAMLMSKSQHFSSSLTSTTPLTTSTSTAARTELSSSPLAAASTLLLLRKKPLPNAGNTADSKIAFLHQRAAQAHKVLSSWDT